MKELLCCLLVILIFAFAATMNAQNGKEMTLAQKIKRFAPTTIAAETSKLSAGDKKALKKLVEATRLMDSIYIHQVWGGNADLLGKLKADKSPAGKERLRYFLINMGPWSKLDHDTPFIDGVPNPKPAGAAYYPESMTKDDFEKWTASLSDADKAKATGFFWTIQKDDKGGMTIHPYSEVYKSYLEPAAKLLREAAELTTNATLKSFLTKRADAFMSDNYYESDVAWMDLDSPIEPTIGPYETYMDELFNYKAAFESFIGIRNDVETKKLAKYSSYLQEIEDHLPIDPSLRNPKLGALSPIRVIDLVINGGEARPGVQTAAFNLPNDDKVVEEKGSKRVMLKNVQEAKFKKVLIPISKVAVAKDQQPLISFEPFFTHILAHELMHGLGPHNITVGGKATNVRQELKDLYSAFEEAKADISGLFLLQYLIDKGVIEKSFEKKMYATYLAGTFRSVRFGVKEAHGKGMALQFNYLMDEKAFTFNPKNETFSVNFDNIKGAMTKLTHDIMSVQAAGDYKATQAMFEKYVVIRPEMQKVLDRLSSVPVDINPDFSNAR
jgi:hypothetical protein